MINYILVRVNIWYILNHTYESATETKTLRNTDKSC